MTRSIKTMAAMLLAGATLMGTSAIAENQVFEFEIQRASLTSASALQAEYKRLNDEAERYCVSLNLTAPTHVQICQRQVVTEVVRDSQLQALARLHIETLQRERSA